MLYGINLLLNLAWQPLFFPFHDMEAALVDALGACHSPATVPRPGSVEHAQSRRCSSSLGLALAPACQEKQGMLCMQQPHRNECLSMRRALGFWGAFVLLG